MFVLARTATGLRKTTGKGDTVIPDANMILFRIALRNLIRRSRKNIVVAVLIAVGVGAFFVGNAVLESSIGGIQRTFSDNFTADLSVSEHSEQSFSLFGPDIPVIGEYESEPVILNAADIGARIAAHPEVAGMAYVLSSPLLVEAGGARGPGLDWGLSEKNTSPFSGDCISSSAPHLGRAAQAGRSSRKSGHENCGRAGPAPCPRGQDPALLFPQPDIHYPGRHPGRMVRYPPGMKRWRPWLSSTAGFFACVEWYPQTEESRPSAPGKAAPEEWIPLATWIRCFLPQQAPREQPDNPRSPRPR